MRHRRTGESDSESPRSRSTSPDCDGDETKEHNKEPFFVLVLKVGATLSVLCVLAYAMLLLRPQQDKPNFREVRLKPIHAAPPQEEQGLDELPPIPLTGQSFKDAFDTANEYLASLEQQNETSADFGSLHTFTWKARELRAAFAENYGGELPARSLLHKSIRTLTPKASARNQTFTPWAQLFHRAQEKNTLTIAFIGQSTTAGYGNHHVESFPMIMEGVLKPLLKLLDIELIVRNHAMEHIGPFPYSWCLTEYIGTGVDIIGWDFGPTTPQDLEIWIRTVMALHDRPMLLFRDSFAAGGRHKIIQEYVDTDILWEPTIFDWESAVKPFLQVKPSKRPLGFADWDVFGGPPGIQALPGTKDPQNWTTKQHALAGNVLAMWLLGHAEFMIASQLGTYDMPEAADVLPLHTPLLPTASQMKQPYSELLYFTSPSHLSCYTTFDPALSGHMEPIASGTIEAPLLDPKGAIFYNNGWVLDLEPSERKEKLLTAEWEHLGMTDTQKSYYGVQASGTLAMRIELLQGPLELLVLCESQSPPRQDACVLGHDIEVTVGGEKAPSVTRIDSDAVSYNGKRLCYLVNLPDDTRKSDAAAVELEIKVSNSAVTWAKGACSISHVIWSSNQRTAKGKPK
jgi:hypothetical protein